MLASVCTPGVCLSCMLSLLYAFTMVNCLPHLASRHPFDSPSIVFITDSSAIYGFPQILFCRHTVVFWFWMASYPAMRRNPTHSLSQ